MPAAATLRTQQQPTRLEQLRLGREILRAESAVLTGLADRLDGEFCRAVELLFNCFGCVLVTGMGKAGLVGQKIAATLASTGSRSHFLHPSEAMHGDLGRIHRDDVVLALSLSGETEEMTRLLPSLGQLRVPLIAITAGPQSTLGRRATVTLDLGKFPEADPLGLAPSSSTTAMLALGDALALVTARLRGLSAEDFARFHPGGSLGRKLAKVEELMQPLERCRVARDTATVREVLALVGRPGRRTGAIMLTNEAGVLTGLFTDSDLARLFERRCDTAIDLPIREVMTTAPTTVPLGTKFMDAVEILAARKISELPVIDADGRPAGLLDITDVVGVLPKAAEPAIETPDAPATLPLRVVRDSEM